MLVSTSILLVLDFALLFLVEHMIRLFDTLAILNKSILHYYSTR